MKMTTEFQSKNARVFLGEQRDSNSIVNGILSYWSLKMHMVYLKFEAT